MTDPMSGGSRSEHTCAKTGFRLVPTQATRVVRVARESYGPLNPPLRDSSPVEVTDWSRWDTRGGRTIYAASTEYAAYLELLAYQSPATSLADAAMAEVFPDDDSHTKKSVLDQIRSDWHDQVSWAPGRVPQGWRTSRTIYTLTLPPSGWVVDVEHGDTLIALNRGMAKQLQMLGLSRLHRGHLTGEDRRITTTVATHIREQVLADGTYPHGIGYASKHSSNDWCWALWLRRVDDGFGASSEPTRSDPGHSIDPPDKNPSLRDAAKALGLCVY